MLGEVAVALEVGQHADHRDQVAEVLGRVGPGLGELLEGELLDVVIEGVDDLVAVGQRPGRLSVAGQQGVGRSRHRLADQGEELEHHPVDLIERAFHHVHRTVAVAGRAPGIQGPGGCSFSGWSSGGCPAAGRRR